jgi:hypothetical protein
MNNCTKKRLQIYPPSPFVKAVVELQKWRACYHTLACWLITCFENWLSEARSRLVWGLCEGYRLNKSRTVNSLCIAASEFWNKLSSSLCVVFEGDFPNLPHFQWFGLLIQKWFIRVFSDYPEIRTDFWSYFFLIFLISGNSGQDQFWFQDIQKTNVRLFLNSGISETVVA